MSIEEAYHCAETFQDLCDINVLFLQGVYDYTAYHCGPVDTETIPLLDDLCKLNKLGFYTHEGQPSTSDTCFQQRGYLDAIVQSKHIPALKAHLENSDLFYLFDFNGDTETNIPFEKGVYKLNRTSYNGGLTWETSCYTNIHDDCYMLEEQITLHRDYGVDPDLFKDCIGVTLVVREFNSSVSIEKYLLRLFEK